MRLKSRIAMLKWVDPGTSLSYARTFVPAGGVAVAFRWIRGRLVAPSATGRCGPGTAGTVVGTVCMDWIC
jgi:alanine racemase